MNILYTVHAGRTEYPDDASEPSGCQDGSTYGLVNISIRGFQITNGLVVSSIINLNSEVYTKRLNFYKKSLTKKFLQSLKKKNFKQRQGHRHRDK